MNKITFPLKQQQRGQKVTNLKDGLQLLPTKALILETDDRTGAALAIELERERQYYSARQYRANLPGL